MYNITRYKTSYKKILNKNKGQKRNKKYVYKNMSLISSSGAIIYSF